MARRCRMISRWLVWAACSMAVAAGSLAADVPAGREAKVTPLLAELRAEAEKLSPALRTAVNWDRVERGLLNAGQEPDRSGARATLLCEVYNLSGWPVQERLALLRAYCTDASAIVRRLAVDLLARDDAVDAGSLADLKKVVKDEKDVAVRLLAARQLLQHNDPAGWEPLLSAVHSDDEQVRSSGAVQTSPCRDAKEILIELSLEHWKFGANAARLPEPVRLTPQALELAKKAFEMKDNVIRRTIVEIIGLNRDRAHLGLLLERLKAEEAWTVHRSLFISLGYLGDPAAAPALVDGFNKPKAARTGRQSQAVGLALLGHASGLEALVDLLAKGEHLPVLAMALSRAFDPDFQTEDAPMFLVPDAAGKLVPQWIPAASTAAAPMIDDGKGGKTRAVELSAADVHAAWARYLKECGPRLKWDPARCCFTAPPAK